jgi:aryl-alcohol dehydrogenase-like predicted oxidoreductase
LHQISDEAGVTPNQVVIAWLLQHTPPAVPIIGGSTRAQIRENLAAATVRLTNDQLGRLDAVGTPT